MLEISRRSDFAEKSFLEVGTETASKGFIGNADLK